MWSWESSVLFIFFCSFLFSVSRISGVGQSVSSVQSLKKTLWCISVSQPPSRCTLFSLNNMLVKCISTPQHSLFFSPPLHTPWWFVSKQHNTVNGGTECSRLMYFIRGSVLHVWPNLTGRKALGQFFWHFKNARRRHRRLMFMWNHGGRREKGRSLLCLLMTVRSLRRQDADGPREHTAGVEAGWEGGGRKRGCIAR